MNKEMQSFNKNHAFHLESLGIHYVQKMFGFLRVCRNSLIYWLLFTVYSRRDIHTHFPAGLKNSYYV